MPFVVDVLDKLGVEAGLLSVNNQKGDGPTGYSWKQVKLVKVLENLDQNVSSNPTTLRAKGKAGDDFAIEIALWPHQVVLSLAQIQFEVDFAMPVADRIHSDVNSCFPVPGEL